MSDQKVKAIYVDNNKIDWQGKTYMALTRWIVLFNDNNIGTWAPENLDNLDINAPANEVLDIINARVKKYGRLGESKGDIFNIVNEYLGVLEQIWPSKKFNQDNGFCVCSIQQLMINGCVCGGK